MDGVPTGETTHGYTGLPSGDGTASPVSTSS